MANIHHIRIGLLASVCAAASIAQPAFAQTVVANGQTRTVTGSGTSGSSTNAIPVSGNGTVTVEAGGTVSGSTTSTSGGLVIVNGPATGVVITNAGTMANGNATGGTVILLGNYRRRDECHHQQQRHHDVVARPDHDRQPHRHAANERPLHAGVHARSGQHDHHQQYGHDPVAAEYAGRGRQHLSDERQRDFGDVRHADQRRRRPDSRRARCGARRHDHH
ncbi:MAG: hypothetical protein HC774_01855 [Sphingomonadales bacterium]|nr:hypothetical protein [Sphingomonadales bacterium]